MSRKVFLEEDGDALLALFVLLSVLAFLDQVLVQTLDFHDLLALPACSQHRAFLPVVDINRLLIKVLVEPTAEVADLLVLVIQLVSVHRIKIVVL